MSKIPLDVVTETLYRLPVKTLLRYRCLSKPCCSIIDDPDFIKLHLKHSTSTKSHFSLILKGLHLYSVELDSLDKAIPFNHYPESIWGGTEVFGSCDGLLALCNSEKDIALLNPSTKKLFKLPVSDIDFPKEPCIRGFVFYGFGRDHVHDDYKIVRLVQFKKDEDDNFGWTLDYEVSVYSLKSDSWRKIKNSPPYLRFMFQFYYHLLHRRGYGVFASGVLHWVLPPRPELGLTNQIVSFDLTVEEFRLVPQPDYGDLIKDFVLDVVALDGCLCLVCNYEQLRVDVWMMKEYGVKESWTKFFSMERSRMISSFRYLKPLAYSNKDGGGDCAEKVLLELNDGKLAWYDLKRKKLKTVRIEGGPDSFGTIICVESLIPLKGGGRGIDEKHHEPEEQKKQSRNKRDDFLSKGFKLVL